MIKTISTENPQLITTILNALPTANFDLLLEICTCFVVSEFVVTIETIRTWFVTIMKHSIRNETIRNLCFYFLGEALICYCLCLYPLFCIPWNKTMKLNKYGLFCSYLFLISDSYSMPSSPLSIFLLWYTKVTTKEKSRLKWFI